MSKPLDGLDHIAMAHTLARELGPSRLRKMAREHEKRAEGLPPENAWVAYHLSFAGWMREKAQHFDAATTAHGDNGG